MIESGRGNTSDVQDNYFSGPETRRSGVHL